MFILLLFGEYLAAGKCFDGRKSKGGIIRIKYTGKCLDGRKRKEGIIRIK